MASPRYHREDIIRREMEAAWHPPSPKTELPRYDAEADPFCPLGVARRFNHLQREAATKGTQSLIDLRPLAGKPKTGKLARGTLHPCTSMVRRSKNRDYRTDGSNGQLGSPSLAGVGILLHLQDGKRFTGVRQPPLVGKGLPSATQINDGLVRGAKGRSLADKVSSSTSGARKSDQECTRGSCFELGAGIKQDFEARIARRDDLLQDLWLKMHTGEGFDRVKGDIAQLLNLYRSASVQVFEDMMRHPDLERIADEHTKRKDEGMRSYREAVAQDADFADGIPEVSAWLGFSTRCNPLFLPPKGKTMPSDIDIGDADNMARFRDAQKFILNVGLQDPEAGKNRVSKVEAYGEGVLHGDRVRAMNAQLANAQETMHNLEVSLRLMEAEREKGRERAKELRKAAAVARGGKLTRKMYRLRGAAACVEEGLERLGGKITAVRVRLFAEKLLIRGASSPAHQITSGAITPVPMLPSEEACQQKQERSPSAEAVVIQAQNRGADYRINTASKDRTRDEAATCIQASTRGHLTRTRFTTKRSVVASETREKAGQCQGVLSSPGEGSPSRREEEQEERGQPQRHTVYKNPNDESEIDLESPEERKTDDRTAAGAATAPAAAELSALETLGPTGVKAFFDSLGLGAYAERLRIRQPSEERKMESSTELQSGRGLNGSDLAKIARAPDPDAELLAVGVTARLHRVKVITALGIKASGDRLGVECSPCRDRTASCRLRNNSLLNDALEKGRPAVTAAVAMHMVHRIRQDQEAIVNALRGLTTSKRTNKLGPLMNVIPKQAKYDGYGGEADVQTSVEIPPVLTNKHADVDRASGDASGDASATRNVSGSVGECEVFSVPLQLLPELEEAFNISCRTRELLEIYAEGVQTSGIDNQTMDAADTNVGSTLEP